MPRSAGRRASRFARQISTHSAGSPDAIRVVSVKPRVAKANASSDTQLIRAAAGHFIRERKDVLLIGPPGVGESHLCQAIGYEAIKAGFVVLYRSIFDLVRNFLRDETLGGEEHILPKYLKPDLLIVDDMGLKQLPKRSGEYLFEIIMRRCENRSTMMTSNRPIEDWGKLIGDVPTARAILDRFLHHGQIFAITGKSYRLKNQSRTETDHQAACKTDKEKVK